MITFQPALPLHQPAVVALLRQTDLLTDDLPAGLPDFVLAFDGDTLVGSAGVDVFGPVGLLRSVAVHPDYRNQHIGQQLLTTIRQRARERGVQDLYLITTTADQYFLQLGFERIERTTVPAVVANTQQFSDLCPSSAVVMQQRLA